MIEKVGLNLTKSNYKSEQYKQLQTKYSTKPENVAPPPTNSILLKNYFIPSFKGTNNPNSKETSITSIMNTPAKNLMKRLQKSAEETGYDKVTVLHVMKEATADTIKYIDDLESEKTDYNPDQMPPLASFIMGSTVATAFYNSENRKKLKPVLQQEAKLIDQLLDENKPDVKNNINAKDIKMSDDLIDAVYSDIIEENSKEASPYNIISGAYNSPVEEIYDHTTNLILQIDNALMTNNTPIEKRPSFSDFEQKANNVLKNITLGTNIFVTYNAQKDDPKYFINTIHKVAEKNGMAKNTTITELNSQIDHLFFENTIKTLTKDKRKNHIVILNPTSLIANSSNMEDLNAGRIAIPVSLINTLTNQPPNIQFIMYDSKNNYYETMQKLLSNSFKDFEEFPIPALDTKQMFKFYKENPDLIKAVKKPLSKAAIDKVIEASAQMDGVFPDKTQKLLKSIVRYNIDKKEINEKDVTNYLKEATKLLKKNNDDSSVEVIFDTGKSIKQMVGKDATKKEALSIVKQIKSNKMGTKGLIIYSQDGSAGGGRKFTAQAIAGDAKVPYIEINTMDFGTKDVGIFGGGSLSPEASMKKLFSMVTTQAEANSNKSAVLFIENFEYFSIGEMVSEYHQKAMAQLLREMEKAENAGLNILVVGSVSNPEYIGEATMKSFKFIDSIEVSTPAFNEKERADIITHTIKESKLKLAGSPEEQRDTIKYAAHITEYFPHISLKNIVKKAGSIAKERGHRNLNKGDFTEAYLQITTGRPSTNKIEEHEKIIATSHECGHATNLEVMNNLMQSSGKPWHLPTTVNFITLDPRGTYGGAVYHSPDKNREYSFEKMFSDIVCSYGGHSAEKMFFGMDGSFGISADLESATRYAELMVKMMGQGARTGKISLYNKGSLSTKLQNDTSEDIQTILKNALTVSDLITDTYADFNKEFTEKYAHLAGTGNCIIDGDTFRKELKEWKARQSKEKQQELKNCDDLILATITSTKKGLID